MDESKVDIGQVLANNYMLAKLQVRIWSGRKTDRNATMELLADKGAVANAASVVKNLLAGNDAKLKETAAAYTRIRSFFYEGTVPWTTASVGAMKGDRLISTAKSINFLSDFAKLKSEATTALSEFLNEYDAAVQASAVSLGALYDPGQYPSKAEIGSLFGAEMSLTPLPETTDFDRLTNIPAELAGGLKELYERNLEAQMDNALSDVQKRLVQELERMDTQLSKVEHGEKTRLFKSMVTNLKHLTEMAESMNFTANSEITDIVDAIKEHLLQHEVEVYKDNAALAAEKARMARRILGRVRDDDNWRVSDNDTGHPGTPSITISEPESVENTEPEFTNAPVEVPAQEEPEETNEQVAEDMSFLASLMEDIPTTADDTEEEEETEEAEKKQDPNTPDFDEADIMFK